MAIIEQPSTSPTARAAFDQWTSGAFGITVDTTPFEVLPARVVLSYPNSVAYLNMDGSAATQGVHFDGGTKSDSFYGSNYSDIITTGGGLSNIVNNAYGGDDSVQGGDSRDFIRTGSNGFSTTVTDNDYATGGAQSDVLLGGYGSDQLWGDADNGVWQVAGADSAERGDWLSGENGNDSLYGSANRDVLFGGAGEDLLQGGAGDDLIIGDARYATFSGAVALPYAAATTQSFRWNAATGGMVSVPAGSYSSYPVMVASGNAFSWVWAVSGDDYTLTSPAGFIAQYRLDVGGGGDILYGGLGNDWMAGQTGDDYLEGGEGNDILYGDDVDGKMALADQGHDILYGGTGEDRLFGGAGDDILSGGEGDDTVFGGSGQDIIFFNRGDGHDTVSDPDQDTMLIFGEGISKDDITLKLGSLALDLGNGDEIHIAGFDPNDAFNSSSVSTFVFADGSALSLVGLLARGFDLQGAGADDTLTGTNTVDRIQGLAGADTLVGGVGADVLSGGAGNDTFIFSLGDGQDEITDGKLGDADVEIIEFTNVASTDVSFTRPDGTDDLVLAYGIDDKVTVDGFFRTGATATMAQFFFSDGVSLTTYADIIALLPTVGNTAPTLTGTPAVLADGAEDTAQIIVADDLLQGYTDADGDTLSVADLTASHGALTDNLDGTWTFNPAVDYYGEVTLNYNVVDGNGGSTSATQSFSLAAVNDAPVLGSATLSSATYTATTVSYVGTLAFTDVETDDLHTRSPDLAVGAAGGSLSTTLSEAAGAGVVSWVYQFTKPTVFGATVTTVTDSFVVSIDDGQGGVVSQSLLFTISTGMAAANTLNGSAGPNILLGATGNDTLIGGAANDLLDGGVGADKMTGGAGDDVYVVNRNNDAVIENDGDGVDTVYSSVSYTLSANLERLNLTGTTRLNGVGNSADNLIIGNAAGNALDGGAGADTLAGGLGNDVYAVDNVGDTVVEDLGEGADTVNSVITWTLGANLENLVLAGTDAIDGNGNALNNTLTGNASANQLFGLEGNDYLNGGAGVDVLVGGLGNDRYEVDNSGDLIIENDGEGTDLVKALADDYTLPTGVENLTLTGFAISGTGNGDNNTLNGNEGDNTLAGMGGRDRINGQAGADTLAGGADNDIFVFRAGEAEGDAILDFSGNGTLAGDSLRLVGFGAGAVLAKAGVGDFWSITYNGGIAIETIELVGVTSLSSNDVIFNRCRRCKLAGKEGKKKRVPCRERVTRQLL